MYNIIINGDHAAYAENVAFIKLNAGNGAYNLCDETEATGIVYDGQRYNINGYDEVDGVGDAVVGHVGAGEVMASQRIEMEQTITDLQLENIELQQRIAALEG